MNVTILRQLIKEKGLNINTLSKSIGMSHVGLSKALEKNTLNIETLEKIAEVLGVSPCYFFLPAGKPNSDKEKFEYYRSEVLEKTGIRLDFRFHIEGLFRSVFLKTFIDTLEVALTENDKKAIMEGCGLQGRPFCFEGNHKFHTRITRQIVEYFCKSNNRSIKNIIRAEYQNIYLNFASLVSNDPAISFLREEEMINEIDLLIEIEKIILSTFNCNINFDLHCLEPTYDISNINDASYYINMFREDYQIL